MYKKYTALLFLLFVIEICTVDIGSDTSVTRFNNQVPVSNGDRIAAFAALNGGFDLTNSAVRAEFDSFFGVSGVVAFNGGMLALAKDLILQDVCTLLPTGTIAGNGHQLRLAPGMSTIAAFGGLGCTLDFVTSTAGAQVNEIDWSPDSQYIVAAINLVATPVAVASFNGSTITAVGTAASIGVVANAVAWHPTNDWIAVGYANNGAGNELFIYSFDRGTGVLAVLSSASINDNVNSVAWHPEGNNLAVGCDLAAGEIRAYPVSGGGVLGAAVTVSVAQDANSVDFNAAGTFLAVGCDVGAGFNELQVYPFNPVGPVIGALNASVDTANTINYVSWNMVSGNQDLIAVGMNSGTGRVRVYRHNSGAGTLTLLAGAQAINTAIVNFVGWNPFDNCLAACVSIGGGLSGEFMYRFVNDTLTQTDNETSAVNVLSGGWSNNGNYLATGDTTALSVFSINSSSNNTNCLWTDLDLYLNNDLIYNDGTITFTGASTINGSNGCLTLGSTGRITVSANSQLTLRNLTIRGLNDGKIQNSTSTSKIVFDNVHLILDGNYSFSFGSFDVRNQLILDGDGFTFNYVTDLQSTITSNSKLILQNGVTFNYAPAVASKTLLQLLDSTSSLVMNGATFTTTTTAIQLTKGNLLIEGRSFFRNAGTLLAQAIEFGDGVNSLNNLNVEWFPAANLELVQGFIRNRNV